VTLVSASTLELVSGVVEAGSIQEAPGVLADPGIAVEDESIWNSFKVQISTALLKGSLVEELRRAAVPPPSGDDSINVASLRFDTGTYVEELLNNASEVRSLLRASELTERFASQGQLRWQVLGMYIEGEDSRITFVGPCADQVNQQFGLVASNVGREADRQLLLDMIVGSVDGSSPLSDPAAFEPPASQGASYFESWSADDPSVRSLQPGYIPIEIQDRVRLLGLYVESVSDDAKPVVLLTTDEGVAYAASLNVSGPAPLVLPLAGSVRVEIAPDGDLLSSDRITLTTFEVPDLSVEFLVLSLSDDIASLRGVTSDEFAERAGYTDSALASFRQSVSESMFVTR